MKSYIGRGLEEYKDFDIIKLEILSLINTYKTSVENISKHSKLIDIRKVFEDNDKNSNKIRKLIEMLYEVKTIDDENYIENIKKYLK